MTFRTICAAVGLTAAMLAIVFGVNAPVRAQGDHGGGGGHYSGGRGGGGHYGGGHFAGGGGGWAHGGGHAWGGGGGYGWHHHGGGWVGGAPIVIEGWAPGPGYVHHSWAWYHRHSWWWRRHHPYHGGPSIGVWVHL